MTGRSVMAPAASALASIALAGCVTIPLDPTAEEVQGSPAPVAVMVPPPPRHPDQEATPPPPPPKPSLSQLTNRNRPHLEFFGAKIYADSISDSGASGNVFLDGQDLHQSNRSFPIAVYAGHVDLDLRKEKISLSDWPIVQTDSAYVQAQARDTVIILSRDRMARIKGPARYVIGNREDDLFAP